MEKTVVDDESNSNLDSALDKAPPSVANSEAAVSSSTDVKPSVKDLTANESEPIDMEDEDSVAATRTESVEKKVEISADGSILPPADPTVSDKLMFPSPSDMNTRIRKLITGFQRYFKKEEIRNVQKAKVVDIFSCNDRWRMLQHLIFK